MKVSAREIAGESFQMSVSTEAVRLVGHWWLFTWKTHSFLDAGVQMCSHICTSDREPSALCALCNTSLGLSVLRAAVSPCADAGHLPCATCCPDLQSPRAPFLC